MFRPDARGTPSTSRTCSSVLSTMTGPIVPETAFTEEDGVIPVHRAVRAARCIWRETPTRDVGIDGQVEYVDPERVATGRIVAVQAKSGPSFFANETPAHVPYTPTPAHRAYWARHPLPVILVLHHPERDETIWMDARAALRDGHTTLHIPRAQRFDSEGVLRALASEGALPVGPADPAQVAELMLATQSGLRSFDLSFFDLFFQGLTDIGHSLYFGMDLPHEIQDIKAAPPGGTGRIEIGQQAFEFLDRYVAFLIAYDLARVDFDAWRRMHARFGMVATFICPLTSRGEAVVDYVNALDQQLGGAEAYYRVAQERSVSMYMLGIDVRQARIEYFKEHFEELRRTPQ